MALPDGIITVPVQAGAALTHTGTGIRLTLTIRPVFIDADGRRTPATITHAATGTILSAITETLTIQDGQAGTVQLPAVDQPGFLGPDGLPVTMWSYDFEIVASHIEPWEGVLGVAPTAGRRVEQPAVHKTLQPLEADAANGIDLDTRPVQGWAMSPLGPVWLGRLDEAPDVVAAVYDEITDPTVGRLYLRSVAA